MKSYAGIGSRETPSDICNQMTRIASTLSKKYILRSGGALGADTAFELGAQGKKEIYLPTDTFNYRVHNNIHYFNYQTLPGAAQAQEMTWMFHPKPDCLTNYAFHLMSRNAMQIFGKTMNDPVDFVICWTENGQLKGGTSQAIRIAQHYNIPIYNLATPQLFNFL